MRVCVRVATLPADRGNPSAQRNVQTGTPLRYEPVSPKLHVALAARDETAGQSQRCSQTCRRDHVFRLSAEENHRSQPSADSFEPRSARRPSPDDVSDY